MYGFLLLCYSNFVRKMHHFWDIRLQKCCDLENRVRVCQGQWKMSPFDRDHMTSYWWSIVNLLSFLRHWTSKNIATLKSQSRAIQGHWKCTIRYTGYGFLLVFYSNHKTHRFWDIGLQMCHDLENRVMGPSRSLKISPFDRAHMTSIHVLL